MFFERFHRPSKFPTCGAAAEPPPRSGFSTLESGNQQQTQRAGHQRPRRLDLTPHPLRHLRRGDTLYESHGRKAHRTGCSASQEIERQLPLPLVPLNFLANSAPKGEQRCLFRADPPFASGAGRPDCGSVLAASRPCRGKQARLVSQITGNIRAKTRASKLTSPSN